MALTEVGYGWMATALGAVADATAGSRVGILLEGGYDLTALEQSVAATLRGTLGWPVPTPWGEVSDHHREAIEAARQAVERATEQAADRARAVLGRDAVSGT